MIEADTMRVVLGITGGTGAGKTSALNAIRDLGGTIIDCDAVYHEMLMYHEEMRNGINAVFPGVFQSDGQLNRKKLGQEVFAHKDRLTKLNGIVYQYLLPEIERRVLVAGDGLYAIDEVVNVKSAVLWHMRFYNYMGLKDDDIPGLVSNDTFQGDSDTCQTILVTGLRRFNRIFRADIFPILICIMNNLLLLAVGVCECRLIYAFELLFECRTAKIAMSYDDVFSRTLSNRT